MLIATFGPTTAWVGKRITWDHGVFTVEGQGPVTAAHVMEYDRQGHVIWVNEGARAWVGSRVAAGASPAGSVTAKAAQAWRGVWGGAASSDPPRTVLLKRVVLIVIGVLALVNLVLVLVLMGVVQLP
jgi:hypothetical protein